MSSSRPEERLFVGRREELDTYSTILDHVKDGRGSVLSVSGEAGIGKTHLVNEFLRISKGKGFNVLTGAADINSYRPFHMFTDVLKGESEKPIFQEEEQTSFAEIFAVDNSGLLLADTLSEGDEEMDGDIFAGMLSAVQNFVKDSFDRSGDAGGGLGRLEYGDMKILIEHGAHIYVAAVIKGKEHPQMKRALARTVKDIEREDADMMEAWSGDMEEMRGVQSKISTLSNIKYTVRKELEGVKLENERIQIADRFLDLFTDMSDDHPLLILLEDLQWTDESSLFVIDYLSRNINSEKILIICTRRSGKGEATERVVGDLQSDGYLEDMRLSKLTIHDLKELVDGLYSPNEFPDNLVNRLSDECEGNPFFVIEMLKQMEQEGGIEMIEGTYRLSKGEFTIPSSVEEVVYHRLELLEPQAIALIEYASCEGGEIDSRIPEWFDFVGDSATGMEALMDSGMLVKEDGKYSFSHAIFRDVIYDSLSRWWKNSYHHRLGEYYELTYRDDLPEVYYELARHYGNTNDHSKAYDYSYKAGEKAENALAPEQAIVFYGKALNTVGELRLKEGEDERRRDILERLGDMRGLLGDLEDALEYYHKGLDLTEDTKIKAVMHRKLGNVFMITGEYDRSIQECDTGIELLEENDPEVVRLNRVKGRTYMRKGDYDDAIKLFEEGLALAELSGDDGEVAEISHNLGTVEWYRGNYGKALEYLEDALEIRKKLDDHRGVARTATNIGIVYYSRGDLDRALEYYRQALVSFEKMGDKVNLASVYGNMGMAYFKRSSYEKALEHFELCLDIFQRVGDKGSAAASIVNIALVHERRGDTANALVNHKKALEIMEKLDDKDSMATSILNMGSVYIKLGDMEKGLYYNQKALELSESIGGKETMAHSLFNIGLIMRKKGMYKESKDFHKQAVTIADEIGSTDISIETYCELVRDELAVGDVEMAMEYAIKAEELSKKTNSRKLEGCGKQALAIVYSEQKRWERAVGEFETAKALLEEGEENMELAPLLQDYGLMWKKKGDYSKARDHLKKALEVQVEMGLEKDAERTNEILASIDH